MIDVQAGDYVLHLGVLDIASDMTITGSGAGTGAGATTIDDHWYLAPNGPSTAVLRARHGIVQEIGIGNR